MIVNTEIKKQEILSFPHEKYFQSFSYLLLLFKIIVVPLNTYTLLKKQWSTF